jgi:3-hydroxyacyl-CoA dehydrogenase
MASSIKQVAIGTGVIGKSWAALCLVKGLKVVATDVAPDAEAALKRIGRRRSGLGLSPGASRSNVTFTGDLLAAVIAKSA